MSTLLVVGDDKIGRAFLRKYPAAPDLLVALDRSTDLKRVFRLVRRGTLPIAAVLRMAWANLLRPRQSPMKSAMPVIQTNRDLLDLIENHSITRVLLFRAGLIVRREVLDSGVAILNIHCASLEGYGGLASIYRALKDKAVKQEATLHRVTEAIDRGEVLDIEPYKLESGLSYRENEDLAYAAGMRLLTRTLDRT